MTNSLRKTSPSKEGVVKSGLRRVFPQNSRAPMNPHSNFRIEKSAGLHPSKEGWLFPGNLRRVAPFNPAGMTRMKCMFHLSRRSGPAFLDFNANRKTRRFDRLVNNESRLARFLNQDKCSPSPQR
jgi:hypothetical protein